MKKILFALCLVSQISVSQSIQWVLDKEFDKLASVPYETDEFLIVSENGKEGVLKTENLQSIIPMEYSEINYSDGVFIAKNYNNYFTVFDVLGRRLINNINANSMQCNSEYCLAEKANSNYIIYNLVDGSSKFLKRTGGQAYFLNNFITQNMGAYGSGILGQQIINPKTGAVVIPNEFELIHIVSAGSTTQFIVKKNGFWGVVSENMEVVVPIKYTEVKNIGGYNGYYRVANSSEKYGIINRNGVIVIDDKYDNILDFGNLDTYFHAILGKNTYLFSLNGKLIKTVYDGVFFTFDKLKNVNYIGISNSNSLIAIADLKGNMISQHKYQEIAPSISGEYSFGVIDGKSYFFDKNWKTLSSFPKHFVPQTRISSNGYMGAKDKNDYDKSYLLHINGSITPIDNNYEFQENELYLGYAIVYKKEQFPRWKFFNLVDTKGNSKFPFDFDSISQIKNNMFVARKSNKSKIFVIKQNVRWKRI